MDLWYLAYNSDQWSSDKKVATKSYMLLQIETLKFKLQL